MSNRKLILIALISCICGGALLICWLFLIKAARVPGGAMSNTIVPGERVLMVKSFGKIERGQVVVFQYPDDPDSYIKRVVGLPGETIQLRGQTTYINGRPLKEEKVLAEEVGELEPLRIRSREGSGPYTVFYLRTEEDADAGAKFGTQEPFRVPADQYFLLGDNRDNSEDSRYRGPVPRNLIWGTVVVILSSDDTDRIFTHIH